MNRALVGLLAACLVGLASPVRPVGAEPAAAPAAPAAATPPAQEAVVGVSVRGAHRAYPESLFSARRVLNDEIGDMEVAIFHDPERGLSTAWFRMVLGEPIEFSGTAAGSVAEDLTTITRWDLTTGVAVGGNLQGQRLVPLPVTVTSWAGWAATHPKTEVYRDGR